MLNEVWMRLLPTKTKASYGGYGSSRHRSIIISAILEPQEYLLFGEDCILASYEDREYVEALTKKSLDELHGVEVDVTLSIRESEDQEWLTERGVTTDYHGLCSYFHYRNFLHDYSPPRIHFQVYMPEVAFNDISNRLNHGLSIDNMAIGFACDEYDIDARQISLDIFDDKTWFHKHWLINQFNLTTTMIQRTPKAVRQEYLKSMHGEDDDSDLKDDSRKGTKLGELSDLVGKWIGVGAVIYAVAYFLRRIF